MTVTINLDGPLSAKEELWLCKNVGPRMHYIHNSIGGQGWVAKKHDVLLDDEGYTIRHTMVWKLTLQDDKYASWFTIMFPQ